MALYTPAVVTEDDERPSPPRAKTPAKAADARAAVWVERLAPYVLLAVPVALLARAVIVGVHRKIGHPGAALDDAYIHFQYARAIAEGHPMRYFAGEPITSGATSLLWPAALAPFWALGLRGEGLMWPAWAFSFAALGALAWDVHAITKPLAGRAYAIAAGAMVLCTSAFAWCAASGMEVIPFAWAMARVVRRAAEWAEAAPAERTPRRRWELAAMAWVCALLRPEGALLAVVAAAALATELPASASTARAKWTTRAWALAPLGAVAFTPALLWLVTGSPRSTTAEVKLLAGNPYYPGPVFWQTALANARTFFGTLLAGEVWSAEFLPTSLAPVFVSGVVCVGVQGWRSRRWWRAAGVLLLAAMMLVPCTYVTFLWNRLRYLWPFFPGWLVGLACLGRVVGDLLGELRPRYRVGGVLLAAAFAGALFVRMEWTLEDASQSASGIDRQQVALGRWAKENLPKDARVGVNDTGAIAYFGERTTFDIVGLTTAGEGRYWVAGVGSRLEHYERLRATAPAKLPTHFIVYPEWMGLEMVLGKELHRATVTDATILGGQTMRVHEADWSLLGSGELPWTDGPAPTDALDVADLESEAEHGYELLGARDNTEVATSGLTPATVLVVDGGRSWRSVDRFALRFDGKASSLVARVEAGEGGVVLEAIVDGAPRGERAVEAGSWTEVSFDVQNAPARATVEVRARGGFVTTYHYWAVPSR